MASEDYETAIKKLLRAQRRPLSTKRIATKTHITWPTAKKYLSSMKSEGIVSSHKDSNRTYWKPVKVKSHTRKIGRSTTRVGSHRRNKKRIR